MLNRIRNIYTERPNEHFLKEKDNWAPLVFGHPFSIPLLRLMQKLHLKTHPNVITLASFPPILAAAYFFFCDKLLIGAFCYLGYFIVDGLDGKWARLTGRTSEPVLPGRRLDYRCRHHRCSLYYRGCHGNIHPATPLQDNLPEGSLILFSSRGRLWNFLCGTTIQRGYHPVSPAGAVPVYFIRNTSCQAKGKTRC
jgi:hypothetical protein